MQNISQLWKSEYNTLDKDQQEEIRRGLEKGLNVSFYDKSEFLSIQMMQIRLGLEKGLNVAFYANPEYDWFQMEEIREGLMKGVDVSKYANPNMGFDCMRQIRKGLEIGLDLSPYKFFKAPILRELRHSLISKVDILPYIRDNFDAEQLREIRLALEHGVNVGAYITKEFRGVAICEIRLGLEKGIDVTAYADVNYSWQQMKEIRLGLENRVDISLYSKHLYSWQQMKEIRLGLESGLDVSIYNSFVYTAKDMQKKRKRMLELIADDNNVVADNLAVQQNYETKQIDNFSIKISDNGMEAWLKITGLRNKEYSLEEVKAALSLNGINTGIDESVILDMLEKKTYNKEILIATGTPSLVGDDGYYEYFFEIPCVGIPTILDNGNAEYSDVKWQVTVTEGSKLAVYHNAKEGKDGIDVRGSVVKALKGKEKKILSGAYISISSDNKTYFAEKDGVVKLSEKDGYLSISDLKVFNSVNMVTGNVFYDGDVYIKGDVDSGTSINATGNVVIDGTVQAANIKCGGSILIREGVIGQTTGSISAKGNVVGKFFESVTIKSDSDIYTNYALNSIVSSKGRVNIMGDKGVIVGGITRAMLGITSMNCGNHAQLQTILQIVENEEYNQLIRRISEQIKVIDKELAMLRNNLKTYKDKFPPEVRNAMDIFIKIENAIYTKEIEKKELSKKEDEIQAMIKAIENSKIVIKGTIFEGTVVDIGKYRWNANGQKNISLKLINGKLSITNN